MKNVTALFVRIFSIFISYFHLMPRNKVVLTENSHKLSRRAYRLANIDINLLLVCGIKGIILDLDNTIVSEDDRYLSPGSEDWITQAKLAGLVFFILSNGKRSYRIKYWSERLNIQSINPARKPFPDAFWKALASMRLNSKQVVVIGDSMHTDIIGALIIGSFHIQVSTLPHPPRWWEKLIGKWIQIPYPHTEELWNFDDIYRY